MTTTEQARAEASATARETRLCMYSHWIVNDVDGLTHNLAHPAGQPVSIAILAEARELVALALGRIDRAIERDKAAHAETEAA